MIETLFSFLLLSMCAASFLSCHAILGVNRAFLGIYKGVVEKSVIVAKSTGDYEAYPYFDLEELKEDVGEYFSLNIPKYAPYEFEVTPLRFASVSVGQRPIKVRITLVTRIMGATPIQKKAVFAIERSNHG